jgi:hypothetical protein
LIEQKMAIKESDSADNWADNHALLAEYQFDPPLVLRQLRLCRSKLGSVLEFLESNSLSPGMLEQIGECSTDITADTERLWNVVRPSI